MTAFNHGTVSMLTSLPEDWEPLNPALFSLSIPPNIQFCWFYLPWISLIHPFHSTITSTSTMPLALPWGHADVSYSPALLQLSSPSPSLPHPVSMTPLEPSFQNTNLDIHSLFPILPTCWPLWSFLLLWASGYHCSLALSSSLIYCLVLFVTAYVPTACTSLQSIGWLFPGTLAQVLPSSWNMLPSKVCLRDLQR